MNKPYPHSSGWEVGQEITFVNAYGVNPRTGTLVNNDNPYSMIIEIEGKKVFIANSLITHPLPSYENK